jgi:hypothetical protein
LNKLPFKKSPTAPTPITRNTATAAVFHGELFEFLEAAFVSDVLESEVVLAALLGSDVSSTD